jgi:flagellar assembly factor FliW
VSKQAKRTVFIVAPDYEFFYKKENREELEMAVQSKSPTFTVVVLPPKATVVVIDHA